MSETGPGQRARSSSVPLDALAKAKASTSRYLKNVILRGALLGLGLILLVHVAASTGQGSDAMHSARGSEKVRQEVEIHFPFNVQPNCSFNQTHEQCDDLKECTWCHAFEFHVESKCIDIDVAKEMYTDSPYFECASNLRNAPPDSSGFYTGFHAQPFRNWLNDPNGPMFYNGTYHLFFQYNPHGYTWGNMHWYHMKSKDLLHWEHLPLALSPDKEYDCGGIFSGSATIVDGIPILSYSVACGECIVNSLPFDTSDPNLTNWTKPEFNPVYYKPKDTHDFRDPTEAWKGKDGLWRQAVGCNEGVCLFKSKDFIEWTYTGILWPTYVGFQECPDFFNLPGTDLHVLKGSVHGQEWWTVGKYEEVDGMESVDKFYNTTDDIRQEGSNDRFDMGKFYASKTFYDPQQERRILFGWINYHCTGTGWSGVQSFPREVLPNPKKSNSLITYPIPEIVDLYESKAPKFQYSGLMLKDTAVTAENVGSQLDLFVSFKPNSGNARVEIHVFVDSKSTAWQPFVISISEVGATLNKEPIELYDSDEGVIDVRILVDRSVSEIFVQGGRDSMSSPYCTPDPELLDGDHMGVKAVNAGEGTVEITKMEIFQVKTANLKPKQ
mmetsp:Transcript_20159/g.28119  ORF Transcript_20159/g.28119 Transcript_20159/m.28119 type:complete len:609 (-) Transcript_20159:476-2302(-)